MYNSSKARNRNSYPRRLPVTLASWKRDMQADDILVINAEKRRKEIEANKQASEASSSTFALDTLVADVTPGDINSIR